jgi:hypothetical protein
VHWSLEAGRRQGWGGSLRVDLVRSYVRRFMAGDLCLAFRVWALMELGARLENHDELR